MKKAQKRSIYLALSLIIILTITVTMTIYASYTYTTTKENLIKQMKMDSHDTVATLNKNIKNLIEAYAENEYVDLIKHELERKGIYAIIVEDYKMGKILGKKVHVAGHIKTDTGELISFEQNNKEHKALLLKSFYSSEYDILGDDNSLIGKLRVYVSDTKITAALNDIIEHTIITVFAISFFLVVVLFIAIRFFIFKPMGNIIQTLQVHDKDGIPLNKIENTDFVELDWFVDAMNNMIKTIKKSRASLSELKERFELAWEGVNDGIWDWNIQEDEVFFSQRWKSMLGYHDSDIINKPSIFFELIHDEDKPKVEQHLQEHFKDPENNPYYLEARLRCKDGSYKWILLRGKATLDEAGNPLRMLGSHTDITHTKEAAEMITKAEVKFHTLFQESLDAIVLLDLQSQHFIEFNNKALSLYGYTKEEFEKLTPLDLTAHFTDLESIAQKQEEIIQKGWDQFFTKHRTKEGKILDIAVKSKRVDINKKIFLYITLHDITKEKENELKLARSLQLQTSIFNNVGYMLIRTDEKGVIQQINKEAERVLGYSANELINKQTPSLLHINDEVIARSEAFSKELKQKVEPGFKTFVVKSDLEMENEHEWTYVTKEGNKIPVLLKVSALKDKSGHTYGYLGVAQDITQRKLLESQSKLASMGEMIGNIAHQWRQPLSVISTIASGVKVQSEFGTFKEEAVIPDMEHIVEQTQYLSKTIDDFRDFIKNSNKSERFSLLESIDKALNIMHSTIVNNNITLVTTLDDDMKIEGFKNQLVQALINIINNAKDALSAHVKNEDERFIFVETHKKKNQIEITITDNAGGIDETIINKVFEPYFTTKHQSVGTGIGLSMAHQIITQHHLGNIEVSNTNFEYQGKKYKGACFTIKFIIH